MSKQALISIVVPIYNEELNVPVLVDRTNKVMSKLSYGFELILVNDGSNDNSQRVMDNLAKKHRFVKPIHLARNFGKEITLTAGLHHAKGDAVIMMDADLQHPPAIIPKLIRDWEKGSDVVIGVRSSHGKSSIIKDYCSKLFYAILNRISQVPIIPHATDFRLLDRAVVDNYNRFTERNRMVRGLVDWLGFERSYIHFDAAQREHGTASYGIGKLMKLATDSFVSMSIVPLRVSGYLGLVIILFSGPAGLFMFLDNYFLDNRYDFSGPASLGMLTLFLIGITLFNLGLMSLYIASIHNEVTNRPLYVVKSKRSSRK